MKKLLMALLALMLVCGLAGAESCLHSYRESDIPIKSGWWFKEHDVGFEYRVYYKRVCRLCGDAWEGYVIIPDGEVPQGGVQVCPHEALDFETLRANDKEWALQVAGDTTGFSRAVCTLCNEEWLFYQGDPTGLTCDGRNHIFVRLPAVLEEGWFPDGESWTGNSEKPTYAGVPRHAYRKYYLATCVGCDAVLKSYIRAKNEDGTLIMGEEHSMVEIASYHPLNGTMHVSVMQCTVCGYTTENKTGCGLYSNKLCEEELKKAWEFYGLE